MAPRVRDDLPHALRIVAAEWIPLSDGTRLAARLWLPEGADQSSNTFWVLSSYLAEYVLLMNQRPLRRPSLRIRYMKQPRTAR